MLFDIIVGNPPYGIVYNDRIKEYCESTFSTFKRNNDIYTAFYESSFSFLKISSILSFITPNSFLVGDYFKQLRENITSTMVIKEIIDYRNVCVFSDQTVYVAISIFVKSTPHFPYNFTFKVAKNDIKTFDTYNLNVNSKSSNGFRPYNALLDKVLKQSDFLLSKYYNVKDIGFNYWTRNNGKRRGSSIASRVLYSGNKESSKDIPFLKGRDIDRYSKKNPSNYLRYNYKDLLNVCDTFRFSKKVMENKNKIIYRQTADRIIATLDNNGIYNDKTIHCIIPTNDSFVSILYLLGLLNSKLYVYLYRIISQEGEGRSFSQIKTVYVKQLPIKLASSKQQLLLADLVKQMIEIKEQFNTKPISEEYSNQDKIYLLDKQIDNIIYSFYNLSQEEVDYIESTIKPME